MNENTGTKRICIVRQWYYPADPRVRREAKALIDKGYKVDIICLRKAGEQSREIIDGVSVYRLPLSHRRGSILSYLFKYSVFFILSSFTLWWLYFRYKYELIQVNTMPDFLVFVSIIPKLLGAKVLLDMHEPMPELWETKFGAKPRFIGVIKILKWIEQLSIQYADKVLIVTEQLKKVYIARGANPSKVTVALNVPDNKWFNSCSDNFKKEARDEFTLISHGSIEKRYGLDTVIKAVAILKDKIPNIQLNIIGEGEYLPELKKLVAQLQLDNYVHFLGYLPFEEMLKKLIKSDIGLVPMERDSYSDLIHTNKMFEYIAMGTPVVISRTKAVKSYFDDSMVVFFESGDEEELADKILWLYNHPEERIRFANSAKKFFEKYNWQNEKQKYYRVIEKLLRK